MGRKIAAAADFHAAASQIPRLISDSRPDRVDIRFCAHQFNSQPMVLAANIVAQQYRRPSLTEISTSTAPSLLKSPIAMPRAENVCENTGPLCSLTF